MDLADQLPALHSIGSIRCSGRMLSDQCLTAVHDLRFPGRTGGYQLFRERTTERLNAAPHYSFTERDEEVKGNSRTVRTYRVLMIEGSPWKRLVAVDDQPLRATQDAREERQLSHEIERRKKEGPEERASRVAKYERERNQDQALLREMTEAFEFSPTRRRDCAWIRGPRIFGTTAAGISAAQPGNNCADGHARKTMG